VSALAAAAVGYLHIRRALGHKLVEAGRLLDEFVRYLEARELTTISVQAAVDWASAPAGANPTQIAKRLSVARGFACYLATFDPATEIPPRHLMHVGVVRRTPFAFTGEQVEALITVAGRLRPPLRAASISTLIGLMAATGIRTCEARSLDRGDFDAAGWLLIRHSKYGKTRRIPLHPSTIAALSEYAALRDRLCRSPVHEAFLITATGRRLHDLGNTFRPLLAEAGIAALPGRRPPRLHDLRHGFAVATLRDWHAAGLDVQRQLPALSTYLGHVNPAHTYWYLQAVPELMTVLADRLETALTVEAGQ
jgi:integrase